MPPTAKLLDELAGTLAAAYADDAESAVRAAAAVAFNAVIEERGWSTRALGRALGTGNNGSLVAGWRRGARLPPPWLALALAAVDAGDPPAARLDAATLRERMAVGGWLSATLGSALGVGRVVVVRWRRGRAIPPRGLAMAIGETERRTPRADRRALPNRDHAVGRGSRSRKPCAGRMSSIGACAPPATMTSHRLPSRRQPTRQPSPGQQLSRRWAGLRPPPAGPIAG